jgi:aspartate/methionine/tyrosine aminotransferase
MPEISHKGQHNARQSHSETGFLLPTVAKDRGTHVIHLNIGQPDIATPPQALASHSWHES